MSEKWFWRLRLFERRTIWWPTWAGFCCFVAGFFLVGWTWVIYGESFLAQTVRAPADTLVVEGWIGRAGLRAAVDEFERGGYRYLVACGGLTSGRWEDQPESYAEMAGREMLRLGVSKERLLVATSENTEKYRTFESAVAVWRTLRDASIKPKGINVFTLGPHARRSELVFAKVNSGVEIGAIGWMPPGFQSEPWWHSSDRSRELLEETAGYVYEFLLNSGRPSNSPTGHID
ncbi:MAG: hypothetical protein WAM44_14895 [Chthoniobacterales bacterium]